jgi:predicted nucleic acid-binding protein
VIVADTNLVARILLPTQDSDLARQVFAKDPDWVAPPLLRSELTNVFAQYHRAGKGALPDLTRLLDSAHDIVTAEYAVAAARVLSLAADSRCSAYDCEFVALAEVLGVPLVTADRQVLRAFPGLAIDPETFLAA